MNIRPKKILIVRTDRIGDLILSTPVIKNLRLAFPESYIAFLCRPYTKDVLVGNPYLDEVITYDKDKTQKSIFKSILFALSLQKKKFDLAIILHPTKRIHLITYFANIPTRIGWDAKWGHLLTDRLPYIKHQGIKHELEYTLDILRYLNIPIVDKTLYFPIREDSEKIIEKILKNADVSEFIVLHPSASCPSKRWPIQYFIELARQLKESTKLKIIVISSAAESTIAEPLVKELKLIDLRGKLTISQLASLLKRARLLISNDSGPVHIASALSVPVISIFGRNDPGLSPQRWRPLGENSIYVHKNVGCIKCLAHNCNKGYLCLIAIKPEEIFRKALQILTA